MATDTTETTFVRCPACRSLVPAVSTRCRMCGATLDAQAASEPNGGQNSGRVRQKTMTTASSNELTEQLNKVREEAGSPMEAASGAEGSQEQPAPKGVDPLAGYLDEDEKKAKEEKLASDVDDDFLEDDDFLDDDFDDDFDDDLEDPLDDEESQEMSSEEIPEEPVYEDPEMEEAAEDLSPVERTEPESKPEEVAPKVLVDHSRGRPQKGGLSFGPKSDATQRRFDIAQPPKRAEASTQPSPKARTEKTEERPKDTAKRTEQVGMLYGWLVSYSDPQGSSIELRQGRFFVSAAQLRPTDMVFDDATVSTPHAMFTISDDGIIIQDLKSERGVFVRDRGSNTYRREYDTATLRHGDWVRFGDLEFKVSVVAGNEE